MGLLNKIRKSESMVFRVGRSLTGFSRKNYRSIDLKAFIIKAGKHDGYRCNI